MSKFFKALKTTAIAALCAVGMMSLSGCENYGKMLRDSPEEYIGMAMENTMEGFGGNTFADVKKLLEQALEDGSFSLGFEAEGITFNGVCEVSEKPGAVSQMYTLSNAEGNSAQIYFYADEGGLKLGTVGDSGSHIYDVSLESFAEKLAASIFAPDSDSAYAMSETDYKELLEYAEALSAAMGNAESQGDDKYQKLFDDFKNGLDPVIEEKTDIDIGGETVSANTVTYTVTTEKIKDLLNKLFDFLLEDGRLDPDTTGYSTEEMREQFDEAMTSIKEINVTAKYDINAKTNMLMQSDILLNVSAENENGELYSGELRFNSFYGADPASAEKQTHTLSMNAAGENVEIVMDITHTESSAEVTANITTGSFSMKLFTMTVNKDGENYSASVDIAGEITAGIEGTISASGNSFDMTIDSVTASYGGEEFSYSPKAKVNVKKGGEISVLDAQGEFLDITEEQLNDLIDAVAGDFEWLVGEDMSGYVKQSKITQANANAKNVHTCCTAAVAQEYVDGKELSGFIEGSDTDFTIGGEKIDVSKFLGPDFFGYAYGYVDERSSVEWTLWSKQPIPDEYKHQLTEEEQEKLAENGITIGCFPLNYPNHQ